MNPQGKHSYLLTRLNKKEFIKFIKICERQGSSAARILRGFIRSVVKRGFDED